METIKRVYVSPKGRAAKPSLGDRTQIIYTDSLNDADYVIILKPEGQLLEKEQLKDFLLAKEAGKKIKIEEENKEKMRHTRQKFDMEIE